MTYYVSTKIHTEQYNKYKELSDRDEHYFTLELIQNELEEFAYKIEDVNVSIKDAWFLGAEECDDVPAYLFILNIKVNEKLTISEKHQLHKLLKRTCVTKWGKILHFDEN